MSKNSKNVASSSKNSVKSAVVNAAPVKQSKKSIAVLDTNLNIVDNSKSKKTTSAAPATFLVKGAAQDALQGRVGARTHAIHVVLLDAARLGALLSTKVITQQATAFMQQTDSNAVCNATASHLNTMSCERAGRLYLVREQGAWRLTDAALALCGATWAQDVKSSKKSKK